jgi:phage FluMu protein Com
MLFTAQPLCPTCKQIKVVYIEEEKIPDAT